MVREVVVKEAFGKELQSDGTSVVTLDGYDGCQLQCPYCFQFNQKDWGQEIRVRKNIGEVLEHEMESEGNSEEPIFVGSLSDPYMPLEEKYGLTRTILKILVKTKRNVFIVTKSDNRLILRDLELLKQFGERLTVIFGLANIRQAGKGAEHVGIQVDVHITPVLPYIMDVHAMIRAVEETIPIYVDKLRVFTEGGQDKKVYEWILKEYPYYQKEYEDILFHGEETYYKKLLERYQNSPRVQIVFA